MTTEFEMIVAGQEYEYARQVSNALFREIDYIEKVLTKYDPGSDIGQINLLAPGEHVRIGLEALDCLEIAAWAHNVSGGLFDPTLGKGFQWLEIDRANFSAGWKKEGRAEIDLGGVGKGYAIDKAAQILPDWEVEEVILNAGSSTVLALGREWTLGAGGPWGERYGMTEVKLQNQALSGSGTEVKGGHIVNPGTGKPAERHLAAWAVHPSAARSDALSTSFMMMEQDRICELCKAEAGLTAFVVNQDETLIKIGV